MKNGKYDKYIYWGVTTLIVVLISASFVFIVTRYSYVEAGVRTILGILAPIIYGAVMAYLLAPVYNKVKRWICRYPGRWIPDEEVRGHLGSLVGTITSVIVLVAAVTGLIAMLIPELINSISGIVENFPNYVTNLQRWLAQILRNNPEVEEQVLQHYSNIVVYLQDWLQTTVIPNAYNLLSRMSTGVINVIVVLKNIVIGLIVMVYLLNMKERFCTQGRMIVYSFFPLPAANKIMEEFRYIHSVFGRFITGKILDSIIIGLMCFVSLKIMNMPYVLLVSVIVGCTNVIPFFGPFIGAVPAAFLILLVSPVKCLYFIIFIILLQMFDGYILGPRILGGSTGVSSFWILFSILLFGGLFGFVGMLIAVPTFAVIYKLFTELVVWHLKIRHLSGDITDYEDLDHIDPGEKTYFKNDRGSNE
jgi:predicted PurR-regulated permease PerM